MNPRMSLFSASLPGWGAGDVIEVAALLGFSGIEWGVGSGEAITDRRSATEARDLCRERGLGCSGLALQDKGVNLSTPGLAAPAVELARALGAPHFRVRAPGYRQGESLEAQRRAAREGLAALVTSSAPHGLAVLVETSPDSLAPTPDAALALVQGHSPAEAGVLYDPGNMIIEGHVEPRLAIAGMIRYLVHVHVKNVAWHVRDGAWHWDYAGLAAGLADWAAIMPALAAAGYAGRFSIDHLPGRATRGLLRDEAEALSALIDRAFAARDAKRPQGPSDAGGAR